MLFSSGLQQLSKDYSKFTTAIKRLFKVVQAQKKLQIEKSAGITVAGNLVTDMGSAYRFELAYFTRKLLTR